MTSQALQYTPPLRNKVFLFFIYFVYMFSLQFVFVPGHIGTRALLGLLGVAYLSLKLSNYLQNKQACSKSGLTKSQTAVFGSLIIFLTIAVITNLINSTVESAFITYPISIAMIFSGAYLVYEITRKIYKQLTLETIANYLVATVLAQVYIALLMFFVPEFKVLLTNLIFFNDIALEEMLDEEGIRFMGLGVQFFGAGIINCFVLILIGMLFRKDCYTFKRAFYLTFAFVSILGLGMMMSRTTLVGAGLSLALLACGIKTKSASRGTLRKVGFSVLIIAGLALVGIGSLSEDKREILSTAGEYGYEMFVNYFEQGEVSTRSSDELKQMYDAYPKEVGTWIIGDGLFADPYNEGSYYMGIDVGYLRLIFYCGLVGLFAFLYYQFTLVYLINQKTKGKYLQFCFFIYIFMLIANFKGFADLTALCALFVFLPTTDTNSQKRLG